MAMKNQQAKQQKSLLKKLKKQVSLLQKKEKQTKNKLKTALKKIRKLGRSYRSKLNNKVRLMKGKIAEAQALTYVKAAADVERHMLKNIESKAKSLGSAINKVEKKQLAKLTKVLAKKGKKTGAVKTKPKGAGKRLKHKVKHSGRSKRRSK